MGLDREHKTSEAQRRASAKYDRKNTIMIPLKLNRITDADLIEWLSEQPNRQKAIKDACRRLKEIQDKMLP